MKTGALRALMCAAMTALTLALGPGLTVQPALAQGAEAEDENPWWKVCGRNQQIKKDVCVIRHELLTDAGQFLASLELLEVAGEARKSIRASVPPGLLIQPGMKLKIDDTPEQSILFGICFENVCVAELAVKEEFVTAMKSGQTLNLIAFNQQGVERPFEFALAGFSDVYDGEALNQDQVQAKQRALQQKARTRSNTLRQKLLDAQRESQQN